MKLALLFAPLLLAACNGTERPSITSNYNADGHPVWVKNVKSQDMGSGPAQDIIIITDSTGRDHYFDAAGRSTMQGMAEGLAEGLPAAMSFPLGMMMRRPDQTNVTNNDNGGYVAPGAATASASPVAIGKGGTGGAGGTGGVGYGGSAMATGVGTGGNAAANSSAAAAANAKARSDLTNKVCNLPPPHC